jgi:hypothetical protein
MSSNKEESLTMEGNEVIARFMDATVRFGYGTTNIVQGEYVNQLRNKGLRTGGIDDRMISDNLQFHTSWDWLIPACKKWDNLFNTEPFLEDRQTLGIS